jgi:ABC-type multidrug transport system permease subunit
MDNDQAGALQRAGLIYFSILIANLLGIQLKAKIILERPFLYRERASLTYSSIIYLLNIFLVEVPFALCNTVLYLVPVYFIAGFQYDAGNFWICFAIYLLAYLLSVAIVYVLCLLSPNIVVANTLAAIVFTLFSNFAGFLITRPNIPDWWIWLFYMDLDMYPIEALLINEMKGMSLTCTPSEMVKVPISGMPLGTFKEYCPYTTGGQFLESLGISASWLLRDSLVMLGWWIMLLVLCALLLKFLVHQKR